MHIYDPYGWIVRSLPSLILIYVGIECLLASYSISDFYELYRNITMSNIKLRNMELFTEVVTYLTTPLTISSKILT